MHYCEMPVGGGAPGSHDEPCEETGTVKYQGEWFCERNYEALLDLDLRFLLRAEDQSEPYEFADTEDGGFEDDD